MPFIDRSQFMDELRANPALMRKLAVIVHGEVGNAPLETKMLNLESIFNRASARGQTLEQVTRQFGKERGGYYPGTTFRNGEKFVSRPGALESFSEKVFKPVLDGSDVSTRKLGFAATGNASNEPGNRVADNGIASGYYTKHKWVGNEVYVQHKPDNVARLEANRRGEPPRPPGDIPMPGGTQFAGGPQPLTQVQRDLQTAYPGYQPRQQVPVEGAGGAGVPLPPTRPTGPTAPGPQYAGGRDGSMRDLLTRKFFGPGGSLMPSEQPSAPPMMEAGRPVAEQQFSARQAQPPLSLGEQIARAFAPRGGAAMSTYIDPNTGRQIVNPGGSGEEAMGITRDVGLPASYARQAPAPQRTASQSPPDQRAGNRVPPAGSVPLPRPRPDIDERSISIREAPDAGPILDEGPTPPGAISTAPGTQTTAGGPAGFLASLGELLKTSSLTSDPLRGLMETEGFGAPGGGIGQPTLAGNPFDVKPPGGRASMIAPPEAGLLAPPALSAGLPQSARQNLAPWPIANGSTVLPHERFPVEPRTVDQQILGGLSPFGPGVPAWAPPPTAAAVTRRPDEPTQTTTQRAQPMGSVPVGGADVNLPRDAFGAPVLQPNTTTPSMSFPSMTLLPFEQWPQLNWFGGPGMFDFGSFA